MRIHTLHRPSPLGAAGLLTVLFVAGCASRQGNGGVDGPESTIGVTVSASLAEVWTGTTSEGWVLGPAAFDVVVGSWASRRVVAARPRRVSGGRRRRPRRRSSGCWTRAWAAGA